MHARFLLAVSTLSLALAGCTVGPNYRRPELSVPGAFAAPQLAPPPGHAIDPATWWSAFGDPLLDSLVVRALRDSPDIELAASRIRQARLQEIVARATGRPTVNASGNVSRVEFSKNAGFSSLARAFSGGSTSGTNTTGVALPGSGITTFALGFDASWEFDVFGGARRGREGARARTEAAVWDRRDAAVSLAAEVAQAYFALRLDQTQIGIGEDELRRQRRSLDIAGNQARVGLTPQIDVTRQQAAITTSEARLEPVRADVQLRVHSLGLLLGVAPGDLTGELLAPAPALGPAPVVPAGLPSDLLRRRPDVRAAERQVAAATADIGVATADLYPKFSLTGMAQLISSSLGSLFSLDSRQLTGTAAGMFPVLDWGRRRATVGMRREDREQAYLNYKTAVLGALRDVEDPLAQLDAERRRNATLRRAVVDAAATAHATEAQYRTGLATQTPLLDAEANLLAARGDVAASDAQLRQMTAALFKAIGGGWETLPDTPEAERRTKPQNR